MIQEIIQNILVYVMMTAILKGLVSNQGFLEIFRFVSGLILIVLFVGPVISLFSSEENWYRRLEENIFEIEYNQVEQEMTVAQGRFEEILWTECQEQIKNQIREEIKQQGLKTGEIRVKTIQEKNEILIKGIEVEVNEKNGLESTIEEVEIRLGEYHQDKSLKMDKETKLVQKKLCERFELSEEAVKVWKGNGGNG